MTTKLADIIIPEIFTPYVVNKSVEQSVLLNSGLMTRDNELDGLVSAPSKKVTAPFWNDLSGEAEDITENDDLTPKKITTDTEEMVKRGKANMWGAGALTALMSGDNPMQRIGDLVAGYWVREEQKYLTHTLNGIFGSTSMSGLKLDISGGTDGAALLTGASFSDSIQLLGDAKSNVTGVLMHSFVENYLVKRQLIEYVDQTNELGQATRIPYFMGKRVFVDDACPFDGTSLIASMYVFGPGAIGYGIGSHPAIVATETIRDAANRAGIDYLVNRRMFIMHPKGISYTGAVAGDAFATDAEIGNGANWTLVVDKKKIKIIKFTFKVTA